MQLVVTVDLHPLDKAVDDHFLCLHAGGVVHISPRDNVIILGVQVIQNMLNSLNYGFSTFFPKSMTPQQVVDSINEAYASKVFVQGNTYIGHTSSGMQVTMYIDSKTGEIISALEVLETVRRLLWRKRRRSPIC